MRENEIEEYLVHCAKRAGGEVRKLKWIGRRGAPDRVVMLPLGETIWVELKAPGKAAKPHQLREHDRMRRMGQVVEVIDSMLAVDTLLNGY